VLELLHDVARSLVAIATGGPQGEVIVHRDMHIRNILVTKEPGPHNKPRYRAKISDFGCGRVILHSDSNQTCEPVFLPITPPEATVPGNKPSSSYDIYGYGILMAQVARRLLR